MSIAREPLPAPLLRQLGNLSSAPCLRREKLLSSRK